MNLFLNLNARVKVRLTPAGRAYHEAEHVLFNMRTGRSEPYQPPIEDGLGYSTWHLHELMHEFGSQMFVGNPELPIYQNDILIENCLNNAMCHFVKGEQDVN